MLAKLQGGGSNYDLAVPSNYIVPGMIRAGLLRTLDKSKLPNLKNMGPSLASDYDPGDKHTVAYQYAATGLGYRADRYRLQADWGEIFGPDDTHTFLLLDDPREVIGNALKCLGYSANSTRVPELRAARDLLRKVVAKRGFKGFDGGPGIRNQLLAGSIDLGQIYVGDLLIATEENKNVQVLLPRQGTTISMDTMALLNSSSNPQLAYEFLNYLLEPKVSAAITTTPTTPRPIARLCLTSVPFCAACRPSIRR